jgi:hypothetical protein
MSWTRTKARVLSMTAAAVLMAGAGTAAGASASGADPASAARARPAATAALDGHRAPAAVPAAVGAGLPGGTQFTGTLGPHATGRWFTFGWSPAQNVSWVVMPTSVIPGVPQLHWQVSIERYSAANITYWISITNESDYGIAFEARYSILN